jgi:8-oxo-dGTP diphosphatase
MRQEAGERPLVIVAAVALVREDGRLLLARRPEGKTMAGLWELPGGKVESGESPRAALARELREELAIDVAADDLVPFTFAAHDYPDFHLLMPVFLCRRWQGEAEALEGQALAWVSASEIGGYRAPEADIPVFATFIDWSKGTRS